MKKLLSLNQCKGKVFFSVQNTFLIIENISHLRIKKEQYVVYLQRQNASQKS